MNQRSMSALLAGLGGMFRAVSRAGRQLFHEVAGAFFLLFAALGGASAWREWRRGADEWRIALAAAFAVLMTVFAVNAFRSARRVR